MPCHTIARALIAAAISLGAAGCAQLAPQVPSEPVAPLLQDSAFASPTQAIRADQILAMSPAMVRYIDEEIARRIRRYGRQQGLIDALYEETRQLLEANRDRIEALTQALLKYETLDSNDVDRIMRGDALTKPTVADLLERERRPGTVIQPGTSDAEPDVRPGPGLGELGARAGSPERRGAP